MPGLELEPRPLALGCMRLSTAIDRDPERGLALLHAAFDAGFRWLDTADVYAIDDHDLGHNERLIARALASWPGPREGVRVATKGGLARPDGRWVANGRARHLAAACEASCRALGVDRIELYQLHAPDPRVPLATSVRALAALQRDGRIRHIGLSNVTVGQLEEASRLVEIAAVQVELSCVHDRNLANGVVAWCLAKNVPLLAYRPLGGPERRGRLAKDPALAEIAARHGATPFEVALAWLWALSPLVVPLPGPSRLETLASIVRARMVELTPDDRGLLEARFGAGRALESPGERRPPSDPAQGEIVLVMGLPGAGKTTIAKDLVRQGYARLNRDETGGRLDALLPSLDRLVAEGQTRVVLDNTYGTRHARRAVIDRAFTHGLSSRCVFAKAAIGDAQVNACGRMIGRYGRLLEPAELREAAKTDPGAFGPGVTFRHQREQEPPDVAEGFSRVEIVPFERRLVPSHTNRAVLLSCDDVLRRSRSGRRTPLDAGDLEILPGRAETLARWRDEGVLLLGLSWQPEIADGSMSAAQVDAIFAETRAKLGLHIEFLYCPHGAGPSVCWCRKPLPGLGVVFIERHRLDVKRCLYVGRTGPDRAFARVLGLDYREAASFFAS